MITEAGADGALALDNYSLLEAIRARASISVNKLYSRLIAIVGHHDSAGNPMDAATHQSHIHQAMAMVRSWGWDALVIGLWLDIQWVIQPVE
jgi:hypothetical protein